MNRLLIATVLASAAVLMGADLPRPAPPLTFTSWNGQTINLANYKGKVVVVEILSTTCPHCQQSAKTLSKLKNELGAKGMEVIGYAINPDADVMGFVRQFGVNFPVGKGVREKAYEFLQISVMQQFYFPQMAFVDRSGNIRAQFGGTDAFLSTNDESNIRGMVQKLLAEGGAPAAPAKKAPPVSKRKAS